jgi:hypothetical protein
VKDLVRKRERMTNIDECAREKARLEREGKRGIRARVGQTHRETYTERGRARESKMEKVSGI